MFCENSLTACKKIYRREQLSKRTKTVQKGFIYHLFEWIDFFPQERRRKRTGGKISILSALSFYCTNKCSVLLKKDQTVSREWVQKFLFFNELRVVEHLRKFSRPWCLLFRVKSPYMLGWTRDIVEGRDWCTHYKSCTFMCK